MGSQLGEHLGDLEDTWLLSLVRAGEVESAGKNVSEELAVDL